MRTKPQPSVDIPFAERSKEWIVELSALLRQQFEALKGSTFIRMNEEEAEAYERRGQRIAELRGMLDGTRRL
jgi:hypothetical protein